MKATTAAENKATPNVAPTDTSLVLRVCAPDFVSKNSFIWPSEIGAIATAPDWKNTTECGNGLHGWLYGQGEHDCARHWYTEYANWMVLEVVTNEIVMLGGKCKFPRAKVRFIGTKSAAADYLIANEPRAASISVIGVTVIVDDKGSAIGGALSSLTGGDGSTLTGGDRSTLTGGDRSELRISWWDRKTNRYRTTQVYVGEDGIKANVKYQLNAEHKFVEVTA